MLIKGLSGWQDSNLRSPLQHAPVPKTGEVALPPPPPELLKNVIRNLIYLSYIFNITKN